MARIKKRGNKYTYTYDNPTHPYTFDPKTGKKQRNQLYASFDTLAEAETFKAELEVKKLKGKFIAPSSITVEEFIPKWVEVYAPGNWQPATYDGSIGMLNNHVVPLIGHYKLQNVTPMMIETLIATLRKKRCAGPKSYNKSEEEIPYLSTTTVRHVYDLLKKMFDKAVEWKIIESNPVCCARPKKARNTRKAWSKSDMRAALQDIEHPLLKLSVHLAFFCSLRNGETMGITKDCIDFSDGDHGSIRIEKTLQRVSKKALGEIPPDELLYVFPAQKQDGNSVLILKHPKTEGSFRKVYLTEVTRNLLEERLARLEEEKQFYADEYQDFGLIFSLPQGWPVEPKLNEKWFRKWQSQTTLDLPPIVFHEIRHTSITYKIWISGGDIKNVGLGAGQSNVTTTEGYNHGFDENQREIARKVEADFWHDGGLDEDEPLAPDEMISMRELRELLKRKVGGTVGTPHEFESVDEYTEYLITELMKKGPLSETP